MKDEFGNRMKKFEKKSVGMVDSNMPVFVRLDGKAFHTWTRGFDKPFDERLNQIFQYATRMTCEEVGQVIMAYSQSDEVTFLLDGWKRPESQIYFGGKIQKIVSVMSSVFTAYFNNNGIMESLRDIKNSLAFFDARVWNVPEHEIENVFIWRQMDVRRNSVSGLGQSLYSHKELHKKSSKEIQHMCYNEKGMDWNDLSNIQKWGFVVRKRYYNASMGDGEVIRSEWIVDEHIPYFVDNRQYLKDIIYEG